MLKHHNVNYVVKKQCLRRVSETRCRRLLFYALRGGRTVICIDALGVFGGVTWDGAARTIAVGK